MIIPSTGEFPYKYESDSMANFGLTDFNNYLEEIGAHWRMNLVWKDNQEDPIVALEKIQSLDSEGIKLVLGSLSSAEIRHIKSYVNSNDMVLISHKSTSPSLAVVDNIFRLPPDDNQQGQGTGPFCSRRKA